MSRVPKEQIAVLLAEVAAVADAAGVTTETQVAWKAVHAWLRTPETPAVAPLPRAAMRRVLAMAEEMSHCVAYGEHDDNEYVGVDPDVAKDLQAVRKWLRGKRSSGCVATGGKRGVEMTTAPNPTDLERAWGRLLGRIAFIPNVHKNDAFHEAVSDMAQAVFEVAGPRLSTALETSGAEAKDEPAWRIGRKLGRTIYFNGRCVGMVDTPGLAILLVTAANATEADSEGP